MVCVLLQLAASCLSHRNNLLLFCRLSHRNIIDQPLDPWSLYANHKAEIAISNSEPPRFILSLGQQSSIYLLTSLHANLTLNVLRNTYHTKVKLAWTLRDSWPSSFRDFVKLVLITFQRLVTNWHMYMYTYSEVLFLRWTVCML